jgi:hypothetical protein
LIDRQLQQLPILARLCGRAVQNHLLLVGQQVQQPSSWPVIVATSMAVDVACAQITCPLARAHAPRLAGDDPLGRPLQDGTLPSYNDNTDRTKPYENLELVRSIPRSVARQPTYSIALHLEPPHDSHREG